MVSKPLTIGCNEAVFYDLYLLFLGLVPILKLSLRTMAINARVITGPDPGAVPGGSTIFSSVLNRF